VAAYQFHTEPFKHQREVFAQSKDLPAFGVLWEQGTGKTKLAIDTACYLWEQGKIDAVLVVAPSGVHMNWKTDELPAHVPTRHRARIKAGAWFSSKSRQVGFKREMDALMKHKGFAWLLVPFDAFITPLAKSFIWKWLKQRRCLYIVDEGHKIKSPGAKRTISIVKSGVYAPYRRLMTGTPVSTSPFDVYSQMRFVDQDFWKEHGIQGFTEFKQRFGVWITALEVKRQKGYDPGYDQLVEYRDLDVLQKMIHSRASRVDKSILDLPPKLYTKRYVELSPKQRALYETLTNEYVAEFDQDRFVTASLAIVRLLRLQQIVCGYVQIDDEEPVQLIEERNPRISLLEDVLDATHHQAIVWARFTQDVDQIMRLLGDRAVRYDGQVSEEDRIRNKQRFKAGDAQFFVSKPQVGAEGLTLTEAKTVVYYSNLFGLVPRLQSEDRAHRIGQTESVTYIDLVAQGTVDEHIIRSLRSNFDIASKLTGDSFKEWL